MILTKHFLYKKIRKLSKQAATRTHYYRSMDDVKYVLVVCEAKDWKAVSSCIETLKAKGKTVHVCVYTQKQEETPIWDYAYLLVEAEKDTNIWGFPHKNIMNQLNGLTVDLLIDLTSENVPVMRYLVLQQPATFKVGAKHPSEEDMYDLSIVMKEGVYDIPFLFGQILNYLQAIRSK